MVAALMAGNVTAQTNRPPASRPPADVRLPPITTVEISQWNNFQLPIKPAVKKPVRLPNTRLDTANIENTAPAIPAPATTAIPVEWLQVSSVNPSQTAETLPWTRVAKAPPKKKSKPKLLPPKKQADETKGKVEVLKAPKTSSTENSVEILPAPKRMQKQTPDKFSVKNVLNSVQQQVDDLTDVAVTWWTPHLGQSVRHAPASFQTGIDQLVHLALQNSAQLQVYSEVPRIRQTSIIEADAAFDVSQFLNLHWRDTNEPVGNTLTVGGTATRFKDHNLTTDFGFRRKNHHGATVELAQRFGQQNNNSTFFVPNDQGSSRLSLNFTQPLMRGRGTVYNNSLTVLAQVDTMVARDEFERQMESHLLEVVRAYWALYLERGSLTQKVNLYRHTKRIVDQLERRKHIDTQLTQLVSARAALAERSSELVRAEAAVKNAETRLRGLLNAPDLGTTEQVEIIPLEPPTADMIPFDLHASMQTAVQFRSEIQQAIKQLKAGGVRLNMAKHEMLPVLNAVTEAYVSGLKGNSNVASAWVQQFDEGSPSYAVGLEYELPIGRRAACARLKRRNIELRQLQGQYRNALETVKNEVEIAVREVNTAYKEMNTKTLAMRSARQEAEALQHRWQQLANVNTSGALVLESLLRAQERATDTEFEFLSAQLTYNLALIHIKRAMGVLVNIDRCGNVSPSVE